MALQALSANKKILGLAEVCDMKKKKIGCIHNCIDNFANINKSTKRKELVQAIIF
jgi:hypothetical protein